MGWRLVRDIFVDNAPHLVVFGPGRYDWGASVSWWKHAHSEWTTDDSTPMGFSVIVGRDGCQRCRRMWLPWRGCRGRIWDRHHRQC